LQSAVFYLWRGLRLRAHFGGSAKPPHKTLRFDPTPLFYPHKKVDCAEADNFLRIADAGAMRELFFARAERRLCSRNAHACVTHFKMGERV
jgi:hypothetical protein